MIKTSVISGKFDREPWEFLSEGLTILASKKERLIWDFAVLLINAWDVVVVDGEQNFFMHE